MEEKSLKMVRSGEFDIHTYGDNHCGTSDEFKVRYHLTCECSPLLDHRGFLFDQINIQQYFESIKRTQLSCERLTVVCLNQLLEHILTENPTCQIRKMELTLSPEPFLASMTHSIDSDDGYLKRQPETKAKKVAGTVAKRKDKSPKGHALRNLSDVHVDGSKNVHVGTPSGDHYVFHDEGNDAGSGN